jgi:hypothetical protein
MNKRRCHLHVVLALAAAALLGLACRLSSLTLSASQATGLQGIARAEDGQVSGSFVYPDDQGDQSVQFSVSPDGLAGFWIEGAAEDDILTVDLRQGDAAAMSWKGVQLDGFGALSAEQKAALDDLLGSDLAYGLGMIPLDIACQQDGLVDPAQVAALLYPLQMRFKYQVTDRTGTGSLLASLSQCSYADDETEASQDPSMIIVTPSNPVPVVFSYFPFDPEGAIEVSAAASCDVKLANLDSALLAKVIDNPPSIVLPGINLNEPEPIRDQWGPCKARCRGACGSDCTTSNCKLTVEDRCEKNQDGENDGFKSIVYIYDCGTHPGCIKHDACYDACNSYYGCGTFSAAFCKHGELLISTPFEYLTESYISCDSEVVIEDGLSNSLAWMGGGGPQTSREVFEYSDPEYSYDYDPVSCPLGETSAPEEPEVQPEEEQDAPVSSESEDVETNPEIETSIAGSYLGVQTETPPSWELVESEYFIDIAEDGTVSGSNVFIIKKESVGPTCTTYYQSSYVTSFSGQINGTDGIITVITNVDNLKDDSSCSWGSYNLKSYEIVCEQSVLTISGDDLEIVSKSSDENATCGSVFKATKK